MIEKVELKYIEKKLKGRQMSYLILKCTGKTNYSKVYINELCFSLSLCGPGRLLCITFQMRNMTDINY